MNVDELAYLMKSKLNQIQKLSVSGEIGKITKANSGHIYFDLLSKTCRVSCVCWASANVTPVSGAAEVHVTYIDYYGPFGKCQAVVDKIILKNEKCEIANNHEATIKKMTREGILNRKRIAIPDLLNHLCVITSYDSAAYHDMIEGIHKRWPCLRTTIIHSSVQGSSAIKELQYAFAKAYSIEPDLIICGRGGGSESDLEVFNHEYVIRCFVHDKIPIISAIGHENDHTLSDLTSDVRAKTPTASIELCIPICYEERVRNLMNLREASKFELSKKMSDIMEKHDNYKNTVCILTHKLLRSQTNSIDQYRKNNTIFLYNRFEAYEKSIKFQRERLKMIMREKLSMFQHSIQMTRSNLNVYSVQNNLENGYCILVNEHEKVVTSINCIEINDTMCVLMQDGKIDVTVNDVNRKRKR